jgi:probable HAF family extracellular repeat protein
MTSPKQNHLATCLFLVLAFHGGLTAQTASQTSFSPQRPITKYLIYTLPDTLGGTASAANAVNNAGWVMGNAAFSGNTTVEAAFWLEGQLLPLGTLGGPNSSVAWEGVKNNQGLIVGISDTSTAQPRGEIWSCVLGGFFPSASGNTCQGFLWQNGIMKNLPTLGGDNGFATSVNNHNQVVGWAETSYKDPTCNAPQVLQFKGYIYDVASEKISALPSYPGDPDSTADFINDKGQIVGISGLCANAVGGARARHAVLWQSATSAPIDMGNIGGHAWNTPTAINNKGQAVGFGNPSGGEDAPFNAMAFYWTESGGMQNLGTLSGDTNSIAYAINIQGQIVGQSFGGPEGSHAFIYQNYAMVDLNSLKIGHGSLTLVYANDVNDYGIIVGGAFDAKTGKSPAFVAVPY